MAAAALSPLGSSVEKTNGNKLCRLLIDGGTMILRNVFDRYHPPANLTASLNANYVTLTNLLKKKVLHKPQWDLLFPPGGATPDSKTFDITLLFLLLINICGLFPPISGWHKPPPSSDSSLEANLTRIKLYRNELYGHVTCTGVQTAVFNVKWKEISRVLVALGLNPVEVVRLQSAPCGEDYTNAVIEWVKSDEEIKSQLGELRRSQQEARHMQEEDHKTLQDTHDAVESVRQIHKDTHEIVKEVLKTQQNTGQIQLEHRKTIQDTQQTVEDVRQTNQGTHQMVREVLKTQQEVNQQQQETVKNLRRTQLEHHETLQDNKLKLDEVLLTHTNTQETIKEVRQAQLEDRETLQDNKLKLDDVHQNHAKTQETVEKVRQIQLEDRQTLQDNKTKLDKVDQMQTKTQETVEKVRQTQLADRQTLQDSKSKLDKVDHIQIQTQDTVDKVRQTQLEERQTLQDSKSKLDKVDHMQTKTRETVEKVRQIQLEDRQTLQDSKSKLDKVDHIQIQTQDTVGKVRQTQLEDRQTLQDSKSKLDKVDQMQTKTQETVEKVRQTQLEYCQTLQDSKLKLDEVDQTQTKTQGTVEKVRQTQLEDHEILQESKTKLDKIDQTQTKTQATVEKVRQTQLEGREALQDSNSKLEEMHQQQTKTQQVVEGTMKTLEEYFETLRGDVKRAVESIKGVKNADREEDPVLRNLVKSEFKGDIEYHVGRYLEGTRKWVFNEVENWLDDRSSHNRVMVISANAGMGKSVIAAVICKRMQEAGRLSGCHFCQHNNARYRNPQLMLQSLSCHLCHALPEYKQALVKQLSRNLGKDLNDMGVEELFALLFKEPLSTVADPGRNMLMVIDGLDESDYQERNELLDVLANHLSKLPCWIRFLCTTRPEKNIAEALKHLKPFQLESNNEMNLEDIKQYFKKRLEHVTKTERLGSLVEKLAERCEGLMLYAYFLVSFIEENLSVLNQGDLDCSLPLAISSIYHSYFKRVENELGMLLVKKRNFLNLLSAVTASIEPLPIGFVSEVLEIRLNSPRSRRKGQQAISSLSSLLPIRNGCLHFIHKSVKDWLTDASIYGEHDFTVDEKEGHRILASLCAKELVELKKKGVLHRQFTPTEKYALHHGVRHMVLIDEEMKSHSLNKCVKTYVLDLELLYAKLCLKDSAAAENILWLQKQKMFPLLSENSQDMLHSLLFLLRKYFSTFSDHPHVFFQTVLNEGGSVLSPMASELLQNKYPEIPYMELVEKQMQQGAILARFRCSSPVACLDISPELDYMVCECDDGTIQMWSLHTGKLLWARPVIVKKLHFGNGAYRMSSSSPGVLSFYRSVMFHPKEEVVLPGVLSHAYNFKGDVKPLFPESSCSFTVCSISGDKTTILTDCPDNPKCIIIWSLRNGSEMIRITREKDVLSFAWSRDGKMLAISHCMGSICLIDVEYGYRTLAETTLPESCGMIKFAPNSRALFCFAGTHLLNHLVCLNVNKVEHGSRRLDVCIKSYVPWKFESPSEAGFLLGDPLSSVDAEFEFVLNRKIVLRGSPCNIFIDMLNVNEKKENLKAELYTSQEIVFSLSGNTIYNVNRDEVKALDISSGEAIGQVKLSDYCLSAVAVKEGVLILTTSDTIELWNAELSRCVRNWRSLYGIRQLIAISEQRVACAADKQVLILDTACEDIVSTIPIGQGRFLACNSKCHVLTSAPYSLQLRDGEILLWENTHLGFTSYFTTISQAIFSLNEQFVVISTENKMKRGIYVLDAASGIEVNRIVEKAWNLCRFISEEECVISFKASSEGLCLYNVKSGYRLSVIDLESPVTCLAACPRKQLVAINKSDSKHGFKLIQAQLRRSLSNRNSKRFLNIGSNKQRQVREQKLSSSQTMFSGLSHQRTESNKSYTSPEKTNSKESLWTVLSQRSKTPLKNTPRASKPEPRKSMRTLVGQESLSPQSVLPKVKSPADRRKPPSFLSSSQTRFTGLSPQRKESNNSYTSPEKTNSKESLSTSTVLDQRSKRLLKNTPRASKPEPQKSVRPLVGQQCLRSLHHENALSKVESHGGRRKPSYLSSSQATFTSPPSQRNNSYTSSEKTKSKASLSTSTVLNQGSKIPLKVTPTTSKPKPQKSTRLPVGQPSLRSFHHENVLSKVENHEDRQKSS